MSGATYFCICKICIFPVQVNPLKVSGKIKLNFIGWYTFSYPEAQVLPQEFFAKVQNFFLPNVVIGSCERELGTYP
jgi:hypothetical protein